MIELAKIAFGAGQKMAARLRRMQALAVSGMVLLLAPGAAYAAPVSIPQALIVPKNITYWQMFVGATAVVKFVMMVLLLASLVTWTIWIAKLLELRKGRTQLKRDNAILAEAADIKDVANLAHGATGRMIDAARGELTKAGQVQTVDASEGLKERVAARLLNIESGSIEKMLKGSSVLATVGAITPFVGLFGTVWGIMNSFIGISQSHTTNLAVVAPGIAEALLATAMGLVAAIPAVIMYNHVARFIAGQRRLLSEASTNIACLLSHEVDRQLAGRTRTAQAA